MDVKGLASAAFPAKPTIAKTYLAGWDSKKNDWTEARAFQFYPETFTDSRAVNFQEKYGIGSSHPIYQWISGSSREIAFDAVFVADDFNPGTNESLNGLNAYKTWIKNPALAAYSKITNDQNAVNFKEYVFDISDAMAWLRSFTYPVYDGNGKVSAPQTCALWFEGSRIASFAAPGLDLEVIPCLMTRCDITYEAFFNNGRPRVATASLTFLETIQVGTNWKYVNGQSLQNMGNRYPGPNGKTIKLPVVKP